MGVPVNGPKVPMEVQEPEKVARFIEAFADDSYDNNISKLADTVGLPQSTARALVRRLEGKFQPVVEEARRVTSDFLVKKIEDKLPILLDAIDRDKVDKSTLRDIAVAFGVLAEKRQLLKGEPTQILTYEERKNLNSLGPALFRELKRRDMVIDVDYHEVPTVTVSNPDRVQDEALSKTAADQARRAAKKRR